MSNNVESEPRDLEEARQAALQKIFENDDQGHCFEILLLVLLSFGAASYNLVQLIV